MKKGWTKRNRKFLNVAGSGCMAGVAWQVSYRAPKAIPKRETEFYDEVDRLSKRRAKAHWSGSCQMNEEAQEHYVSNKAGLRPIQTMQRELRAFEDACKLAIKDVEEANAESKATD